MILEEIKKQTNQIDLASLVSAEVVNSNTKAICDAMSLLSNLDEVKRDYKGKRASDLITDLEPIITAIEDQDIREHFVNILFTKSFSNALSVVRNN